MVSFRPSLIRSRSCSSGAYLVLSLSVFSLSFRFLSSASVPVLATRPLFLPFLFLPGSASQWLLLRCSLSAFASLVFPVLSNLVSHVFFPGSSYSASCLFPFIPPGFAPTAVPPVLPFCSRFRAFPSPFAFFRPLLLGSDYLAFRSFFSLLPVLPCRRFLRCFFPLPSGLFPCLPSDSGTQLPAFPFSVHCLASQWLPQCLSLLPFGFRPLPLCFRFRFWLLGLFASHCCSPRTFAILSRCFSFVNNFFLHFFTFFYKYLQSNFLHPDTSLL